MLLLLRLSYELQNGGDNDEDENSYVKMVRIPRQRCKDPLHPELMTKVWLVEGVLRFPEYICEQNPLSNYHNKCANKDLSESTNVFSVVLCLCPLRLWPPLCACTYLRPTFTNNAPDLLST